MNTLTTSQEYNCTPCGYSTSNKGSFQKHLQTKKHARLNPEVKEEVKEEVSENTSVSLNDLSLNDLSLNDLSLNDLSLNDLITQIFIVSQRRLINHFTKEFVNPLLKDIEIFSINVKKDNTFDATLKTICLTKKLSEEEINTIQSLANELAQSYNSSKLKDPEYFEEFKSDLKDLVNDEKNLHELITFVYEK